MNIRDRKRLQRLYTIINSVAPPAGINGGGQSASVAGFVGYARDMAYVQRRVSELVLNLYWPSPDSTPEENAREIEAQLADLEKFVEHRRSDGWSVLKAGQPAE